nr:hypothetical protein [uncultured Flavobacterium sp.]
MKAIELLKLYRDGLIQRTQIEIRMENWGQKTVRYTSLEELEKEELLQHNVKDWFIGSSITDGEIVINVEKEKEIENKANKINIQKINEVPNMEITNDIAPAVIEIYKTVNQLVKAVKQLDEEVGD